MTLAAAPVANTSTHDWLEGRGERVYLIHMIDDATSELTARFVRHDSTEENMRVLRLYLELHGRPNAFYTDKASLFQTAPKTPRDAQAPRDPVELPPTQIGRALRELSIVWIAAHSPQAKGRVERSFQTAQDRLVKGLRIAGAGTLDEANRYLDEEFVPWWNRQLSVMPANPTDAHRPLDKACDLNAILSVGGNTSGCQRLHNPAAGQDLSDSARRCTARTARRPCSRGNPAR